MADTTLTIDPAPCGAIIRTAAWLANSTPFRFTASTASKSASPTSTARWLAITPATLAQRCTAPNSLPGPFGQGVDLRLLGHVDHRSGGPTTGLGDGRRRVLGRRLAHINHHHHRTGPPQSQSRGPSDAAPRTGHHGHAVGHVKGRHGWVSLRR